MTALFSSTDQLELVAALDAARRRIDADTRLMQWALDLREQLWLGLDLEEMADQVAQFKRAYRTHRRAYTTSPNSRYRRQAAHQAGPVRQDRAGHRPNLPRQEPDPTRGAYRDLGASKVRQELLDF